MLSSTALCEACNLRCTQCQLSCSTDSNGSIMAWCPSCLAQCSAEHSQDALLRHKDDLAVWHLDI